MTIFLATVIRIFLLAFQNQNVIGGFYRWAAAVSLLLAVTDVAIVLLVMDKGWWSVPYVAAGGVVGVTSSMWVHRRWVG